MDLKTVQTELSDEILVTKARKGDREAFGVLVRRHEMKAISVAYGVLRNWESAKDASQNAFTKAYFGLERFQEKSAFRTWLIRIVLNEAKDVYRKERSRGLFQFWTAKEEDEDSQSILEMLPSHDRSALESLEQEELKRNVERAIRTLPERAREVFMLRYLHDFSLQEIAEMLGIALGTVKAHLAHGTEKLKSSLRFCHSRESGNP